MSRYKKRGWFGESHRHRLAAKGITSNKHTYFKKKLMFHGTSKEKAEKIMRRGLPPGTFLSEDRSQAEWFGKDKGDPQVLLVEIDDEYLRASNPFTGRIRSFKEGDDLDEEEYMMYVKPIYPDDITKFFSKKTKPPLKERAKRASPKAKRAFKTSLKPREWIIPSSQQEQEWAESIYTLITGKEPRRRDERP